MYLRVFDKKNQRYYKSVAYCKVAEDNQYQFIVLDPYDNCFTLVDCYDRSGKVYTPLVEHIQLDTDDWTEYKYAQLLKYKQYCKTHGKEEPEVEFLWGYRDVCENYAFLWDILAKKKVPASAYDVKIRTLADAEDWKYVLTQEDAEELMHLFAGFHDATLEKLVYEEARYTSRAVATFENNCWYGVIEVCFEKIVAINIRPAAENYSPEIYDATLLVKDQAVFWADSYMEEEDLSYDGTYIKALSMKYRKIG